MCQYVRIITKPVHVSHHNPLRTVASLPRWEMRSKTLQQWTDKILTTRQKTHGKLHSFFG